VSGKPGGQLIEDLVGTGVLRSRVPPPTSLDSSPQLADVQRDARLLQDALCRVIERKAVEIRCSRLIHRGTSKHPASPVFEEQILTEQLGGPADPFCILGPPDGSVDRLLELNSHLHLISPYFI